MGRRRRGGRVDQRPRSRPLAPGPAAAALQIRAGLLAAELLRVRFEQAAAGPAGERERLGQQIDAFAEEALALLVAQPESSERHRLEADLLATMIRSDFRAKKYEARFNAAVAHARELDPANRARSSRRPSRSCSRRPARP